MGDDDDQQQPLDLSIGGYLARKRARLGTQFQTISGPGSALLAGVHVFVNGRTVPSQRTLWQLITQHGGSFSAIMSPGVTHVVASGLAQTKIAQFRKSRVHVVTPDWIVESIRHNSLLSVANFAVPELMDSSQPSMTDFFRRSSDTVMVELGTDEDVLSDVVDQPVSESTSLLPTVDVDGTSNIVIDVPETSPKRCASFVEEPTSRNIEACEQLADHQSDVQNEQIVDQQHGLETVDSRFPTTEEELMRRIGDHRFDKVPFRNPKLPSCTLTDPEFVKNFFSQSRLHFIGSWKEKFECCLVNELRRQRPIYSLPKGERGHILHVDMDCFFASVSVRDRPDLKDKPVVVSHSKSGSGEVSTCNYVARSFGIRSGMWMEHTKELCPDLVVVGFEFEKYAVASEAIYRIFYTYTHDVQVLSCDEALLEIPLDSNPVAVGEQLRSEIFLATGCTASVGIGESILFARLATRFAKPNGLLYIKPEMNQQYILKLDSVRDLPGVGPSTAETLHNKLSIDSVQQLHDASLVTLQSTLGPAQAQALHDYTRGIDRRSLVTEFKERSQIGTELGWGVRFFVPEQVEHFLAMLCIEVASRLEMANRFGLAISLRVKRRHPHAPIYPAKFLGQGWCESFSKSVNLPVATRECDVLFSHCKTLIRLLNIPPHEIRAVGLYVTRLQTTSVSLNTINKYFSAASSSKPEANELKATTSSSCTTARSDSISTSNSLSASSLTAIDDLSVEVNKTHFKNSSKSVAEIELSNSTKSVSAALQLPEGWDRIVFMELPEDVRKELLQEIPVRSTDTSVSQSTEVKPKSEPSEITVSMDFDNIDLNVLHELPRDLRMEIQFELKKRRTVKTKRLQPSSRTLSKNIKTEVVAANSSSGDASQSDQLSMHPDLDAIKSRLKQPDDAIITFVLSLMECHFFLQVEQTFAIWRKQCQSTTSFNLALELVQERAISLLNSKFRIDPL